MELKSDINECNSLEKESRLLEIKTEKLVVSNKKAREEQEKFNADIIHLNCIKNWVLNGVLHIYNKIRSQKMVWFKSQTICFGLASPNFTFCTKSRFMIPKIVLFRSNTGGILDKLKKFLEDVKYTCRHMHEILNKLKIRTI